jgi:hypothetical protein
MSQGDRLFIGIMIIVLAAGNLANLGRTSVLRDRLERVEMQLEARP